MNIFIVYILPIIEVLALVVPTLLSVAFVTIAERKTMASMQRRLGPNIVGYYGLLQAFADALKLLLKEYIAPTQANFILFFLGPLVTLIFSLLGYMTVPFGPGLVIADFSLGILFMLAVSSLATYGILLAGWSANSKYAFLGSLRSTAQLISYELILSSAILLIIFITGSFNLITNIESQKTIWYLIPLFPVFLIFFIGSVAETNRAPFDLAEAESELVSGFMTEHAAVIFVFFFLAEYASIILICMLATMLFLAGYLFNFIYIFFFIYLVLVVINLNIYFEFASLQQFINAYIQSNQKIDQDIFSLFVLDYNYYPIINQVDNMFQLINSNTFFNLGLKSCIMIFIFIWIRASFPRIRFDQLMSTCWTVLLPIIVGMIIILPCALYSFDILSSSISIV